jgi:hypothetical protein
LNSSHELPLSAGNHNSFTNGSVTLQPRKATTRYSTWQGFRNESMNGGSVMIAAILTGIALSAVYLVFEYRRWIKQEAAKAKPSARETAPVRPPGGTARRIGD